MHKGKRLALRKIKRMLEKDPTNYKLLNMRWLLKHFDPYRDVHDEILDAVAALPEKREVKKVDVSAFVPGELFEEVAK